MISWLIMIGMGVAHAECVPAREKISYPHNGQYLRVHPSGDYLINTENSNAVIIDIRDRKADGTRLARKIETPMYAEAYPVEPRWDMISSPKDTSREPVAMRYYEFGKLISGRAQPAFSDSEHNEYYQSVAELPDSTDQVRHVRTTLYSENKTRDYTFHYGPDGKFERAVAKGPPYKLCRNITDPDKSPADAANEDRLTARQGNLRREVTSALARLNELARRDPNLRRLLSGSRRDRGYQNQGNIQSQLTRLFSASLRADMAEAPFNQIMELVRLYRQLSIVNRDLESLRDTNHSFATPVLSKDGTLIAGQWGDPATLKVYSIGEDGKCKLKFDVGGLTEKPTFAYPVAGKLPKIGYVAAGGPGRVYHSVVTVYDPNTRRTVSLGEGSYPGFTKDGRVIYSTEQGFEIVDPNQIDGGRRNCIRTQDIQKSEGNGAASH